MKFPAVGPATPARWSAAPLRGMRRWGSADVSVQRGGVVRYSLMVFEPGIGAHERRRLRLWQAWPWLGAVVLVVALVVAALLLPAPAALVVGAGVYATGFAVLGWLTASERRRTRRVWVQEPREAASLAEWAACLQVTCLGNLMVEADEALASGRITPVEHALVWSRVYTELDSGWQARQRALHPHRHA